MKIFADVIVSFCLISLQLWVAREGIMLDQMDCKQLKSYWSLVHSETFSSWGVILKEILVFKTCEICGWQKRQ